MNPINPALIIAGPALVFYKGKTSYSKGNIAVTPKLETFDINVSRFNLVEKRESNLSYEVKWTPCGTLDALDVFWAYRNFIPGDLLHRARTLGAIDLTADTITVTAHGFRDGEAVRVASYGTLPAGLVAATLYFLHSVDANTISLHDTEAHALANTNKINITDAGTGTHRIIEQPYLVIHSFEGVRYQFHNAVVSAMPDLNGTATETAIGEITVEAFRRFAIDPTDAAAFYTRTVAALVDTSFDPANIITASYELRWGGTAPWSNMSTKAGAKLSFPMELDVVTDDAGGVLTRRINGISATLTARPNNVDENALWVKRTVQGTGAGRGRRISGTDLNMVGDNLYVRLYGADITDSPANFDGKEDRLSDIVWRANRTFASGVPNDLFYVGAAAPV